ncbi:MAG: YdcF family protein [Lentimicrobiaceae bacterium]|nr:YdcF family protein [Lentimicrobiaceae bacterium]
MISIAAAVFFLIWLFANAGNYLVKKDQLIKADALVVLMGSTADRALQTADLFIQQWAPKVLLVEESMQGMEALRKKGIHLQTNSDRFVEALIKLGISNEVIIKIPGPARSTQDEARLIRNFLMNNPELDTLIVISSSPHTRRASMIFKKALKNKTRDFNVMVYPSRYTSYNPRGWWKKKEDIQYTLSEYLKILNFQLLEQFNL